MTRVLLLLAALVATVWFASPASSGANRCVVAPDPVPLGTDFTVIAHGLTPLGNYYVNITGINDGSNSAHPQGFYQADANGDWSYTRNTDIGTDGILNVGKAKVRIYPYDASASGNSTCWFTVSR